MFQIVEQAIQNQNNPMDLLKQVTGSYSSEQMQNFYRTAQTLGFPNDVLNEVQNQLNIKTQN